MITVISATNPEDIAMKSVVNGYTNLLAQLQVAHNELNLGSYNLADKHTFAKLQQTYLQNSSKFIFITKEKGGRFDADFDALFTKANAEKDWWYKKAAIVMVADGDSNVNTVTDRLTNALLNLKISILPQKVGIANVAKTIDKNGLITDNKVAQQIEQQVTLFINF